jgi:pilus assembly protein CpaB
MKAARLLVLGVAVATAAGAGYMALNLRAPTPEPQETGQPVAPQLELEKVLVASAPVGIGDPVDGQMRWQVWPKEAVTEGFITESAEPGAMEELTGSLARLIIMPGEPIRRAKLIGKDQSFMSSILPAGKRAVAVEIKADTSAGGFVLPNDFVDLIMVRRAPTSTGAESFVTETILKNIRVLAIDQTIREDEEGGKSVVGQTATLELTPQQSEIVTVAQQMADRLALALRSTADAAEKVTESADYLVNGAQSGKRGTVKLIKSGEITEVGARK